MKIGVDAKWYFDGPPSGRRVVHALVNHMLQSDAVNQYTIFLNRKHKHKRFEMESSNNVTLCYVWAGNNLLSNLFVLPFYEFLSGLDVVLYQNFVSPFGKAKKVAYIHDVLFLSNPEYYTVFERLYFAPLKLLTKYSHSIITVSEEEKKRLLSFNFSESKDKIIVAYHGVDVAFKSIENLDSAEISQIKKKYLLPDRFLLYVGRLNVRKNVDNLLVAISRLRNTDIKLVVVGNIDWRKSDHKSTINRLGIENRILFTGAVYDKLAVVYSLAEVFCFPSLAESFGLPPLEAMACGVPVVVSNTTSLPEVCGSAGNYIDPSSPDSIAEMIDKLLTDSEMRLEKRALGLLQAKKFTWDNAARVVIDCLESTKQLK